MNAPLSYQEFPVSRKFNSKTVNSVPTEITIQEFSNRSLIFISQTAGGRLGSFVEVTSDKPSFDHFNPTSNTFDIKILFGLDTEEIHLAARIFAGALNLTEKPILFSLAIKDFSKENLLAVRDFLKQCHNQ